MIAYLAPIVTALLAVLGIFFSKQGAPNGVTKVGYVILALTLCSGGLAVFEVHKRSVAAQEQQETIERLRQDARRINNFHIATVAGINRKFEIVRFFMTVTPMDDQAVKELGQDLDRALTDSDFAPESMTNDFIGGLISKRDKAQVVTVTGDYLGNEMNFSLTPKSDDMFIVKQTISGKAQAYECGFDCGPAGKPTKAKLESRKIAFAGTEPREMYFGLDLADGSSIGKVFSEIQRIKHPFLTIDSQFKSAAEYKKFQRIVAAAKFEFKFYGSGTSSANRECFMAIIAPVQAKISHQDAKLSTQIRLTGFESVEVDLCETGS